MTEIKLNKILMSDDFKFVIDNPTLHHSITEFIECADKMLWTINSIESEIRNKIFEYKQSTVKYNEYLATIRAEEERKLAFKERFDDAIKSIDETTDEEWDEYFNSAKVVSIESDDNEVSYFGNDHEPTLFEILSLIANTELTLSIDSSTIEIMNNDMIDLKWIYYDLEQDTSTILKQIKSMIEELDGHN